MELLSAGSETQRVFAEPSGKLTAEVSAVPQRVRRPDGRLVPVDLSLRVTSAGLAPVASSAALRLSSGGGGALASLPVEGGAVELSWPEALPVPSIEGDTAVYRDVFPDVDLRVRALLDGFTYVLVVKNRQAASDPRLARLRLGWRAPGSAVARAGGGFEMRDGGGRVVASVGAAAMWDSSGVAVAEQVRADGRGLRSAQSRSLPEAVDEARAAREIPDGSVVADVAAKVADGELVITPDLAALADPRVVYPVFIDPTTSTTRVKLRWAYANTSNANRDDGIARVGKNTDGSGDYRSFFAFKIDKLKGSTISTGEVQAKLTHSWSCGSTPINVYRTQPLTSTAAGKKILWDGPDLSTHLGELSNHAHKPSTGEGCTDDPQPDVLLRFVTTQIRDAVQADVNANMTEFAVGFSARKSNGTGESTKEWWKKLDPASVKLIVAYNFPPTTPVAADLATAAGGTGYPDLACTGRPLIRSQAPQLRAKLRDPDNESGGLLTGVFDVQQQSTGSLWLTKAGSPFTKTGVVPATTASPNNTAKLDLTGLTEGAVYRWRVTTKDDLSASSLAGPWCEFQVESQPPAARPGVNSTKYPECSSLLPQNCSQFFGGEGDSGQFTFTNGGVSNVWQYRYEIVGGGTYTAPAMSGGVQTLGGSATVWITPVTYGENLLRVWSMDQAGNSSLELYEYHFLVAGASAPLAHWAMNEADDPETPEVEDGPTLTSAVEGGPIAALVGGPTRVDGRIFGKHEDLGRDRAVSFDGVDDYVLPATAVLDTSRSFAVAAWVKIADKTADRTVVAKTSTGVSSTYLQYNLSLDKWSFGISSAPSGTVVWGNAYGTSVPRVGVWTHLAGAYDVGTRTMKLYVNGKLEATTTNVSSFNYAAGQLQVGRSPNTWWKGSLDDVRVWQRTIDPSRELAPIVEPALVGKWSLDDGLNAWFENMLDPDYPLATTAADTSRFNHEVTFGTDPNLVGGPVEWAWDEFETNGYLNFDAVSGTGASVDPVFRNDQSFTVSAHVRLDNRGADRVIVSQASGAKAPPFTLRYDWPSDKWAFTLTSSDTAPVWQTIHSSGIATVDTWVHLVAIYDAQLAQMRLYVDGALQPVLNNVTAWHHDVPMLFGTRTTPDSVFDGDIDDIRVFQGALALADFSTRLN
ncbi:LamG domain-containing protein [Catellatospora citrea]|uniref:LamG domain-containing protein n=1 Tax=Catellatospora citrea TaxID=53366 RepID=UPI0033EFD969